MQNRFEKITRELADFIAASPSCYHVIKNVKEMLLDAGFTSLREDRSWKLEPGNGYFVVRADSSIIAFKIPEGECKNFQMIASHSDAPTFKIKENEEMIRAGHYVELNVEKYGGPIMSPWFDRPLSIAGRALVEEDGVIKTRLVNFDRDLVMLPNLAIHMNRQVNEGVPLRVQSDMLPIFGSEKAEGMFQWMLASQLGVAEEQILATDLFLYNRSKASIWGANREFFSSPKLDDLQCAFSSVKAFLQGGNPNSITLCCIFDNEEVGSGTKQGADSSFLSDVLDRITGSLGFDKEQYYTMIAGGFMLSADNGHAVHPNYMGKADPTNHAFMNGGVVLKYNANQKYTTDAVSAAVFRKICAGAKVPTQVYVNHSDVAGGSTLGNISNAHISLNTVDIGAPQLAMHSPYETTGVKDTWYLMRAMEEFYNTNIEKDEEENYCLTKVKYPKRCACCLEGILEEPRSICELCGWEDDRLQNENPDFAGGANGKSLREYRREKGIYIDDTIF